MIVSQGTITATGATASFNLSGKFAVSIRDFGSASVDLERSLDGGTSWGTVETYTADSEKVGETAGSETYRFNCTSYTSGTLAYTVAI